MKKLFLLVAVMMMSFAVMAEPVISAEKRQEIEKMLRITGMEKLMDQMITQMMTSLKAQSPDVPEQFWTKFRQKIDTREFVENLMPVYEKYYTLEDLKAVNAFYESPTGKKILSTMPQIMQESMKIGEAWGRKIGQQAVEEIKQEQLGRETARQIIEEGEPEVKKKAGAESKKPGAPPKDEFDDAAPAPGNKPSAAPATGAAPGKAAA